MKPLIEQLSEDNRQKLKEYYKDLQATYGSILAELKRAEYSTEISTSKAFNIWYVIYPKDIFDITDFWELFKR